MISLYYDLLKSPLAHRAVETFPLSIISNIYACCPIKNAACYGRIQNSAYLPITDTETTTNGTMSQDPVVAKHFLECLVFNHCVA